MDMMDLNPIKKVKVMNSPTSESPRNDGSNSGNFKIDKLVHDCLVKVLMYLPILERLEMEKVCQKWKEAGELSWYDIKKLDLNDLMIPLDKKEETLKLLVTRCSPYLTHLTITKKTYDEFFKFMNIYIDDNHQYPWMKEILKNNCPNIIYFDIDMTIEKGYKIPNENLIQIIESMKKLEYLKVSIDKIEGSNTFCNEILDKIPCDMKEIHLIVPITDDKEDFCYEFSNELAPVMNKFNGLCGLTLQGFRLTDEAMEGILQNKNTLTKLDLSNCHFPLIPSSSSSISNLKNLEALNLWSIVNFDVNEIALIAHGCSKLKHIEFMSMEGGLSNTVPYHVFCELKYLNLEYLKLEEVDARSFPDENRIYGIAHNWKELKYFNVIGGDRFTSLDFQEIKKFKNLEFLSAYFGDTESFIDITNNCLELKELPLNFGGMPESTIEKLTNLKKLEKLEFDRWCGENMTGNLVSKIVNSCENLQVLVIAECNYITEASLIHVGKLKHLKKLYIYNMENVPNAMFNEFSSLEKLACYNCPTVNDEGIIKVLDNCKKLYYLDVGQTGITVKTLKHASKRQYVFKSLHIKVDESVKNEYKKQNASTQLPYLTIYY